MVNSGFVLGNASEFSNRIYSSLNVQLGNDKNAELKEYEVDLSTVEEEENKPEESKPEGDEPSFDFGNLDAENLDLEGLNLQQDESSPEFSGEKPQGDEL